MTKVTFDICMSLDGFMTGANQRPEEPLGEGGEQLHHWAFGDPRDREVLTGEASSLGEDALKQAKAAAGDKDVTVMGGAETAAATHLRFRVVR